MKQKDTVIAALEHLSGEGDLEMIEFMMVHLFPDVWKNTQQPGKTMRRILSELKKENLCATFTLNDKTWYEYLPYKQQLGSPVAANIAAPTTNDEEQKDWKEKYEAVVDENEQLCEMVGQMRQEIEEQKVSSVKYVNIEKILVLCMDMPTQHADSVFLMLYDLTKDIDSKEVKDLISYAKTCKHRNLPFIPSSASKSTEPEVDYSDHAFAKYVTLPDKVQPVMKLLHQMMKYQTSPKQLLLPIRAAIEAGCLKRSIAADDFINEFGPITTSSFSRYTNGKNAYDPEDLKIIKEKFDEI